MSSPWTPSDARRIDELRRLGDDVTEAERLERRELRRRETIAAFELRRKLYRKDHPNEG